MALAVYLQLVPWTLWSYDAFHGDIVAGALLLDSVFFFAANDPYTTIASLVYVALLAAGATILRVTEDAGARSVTLLLTHAAPPRTVPLSIRAGKAGSGAGKARAPRKHRSRYRRATAPSCREASAPAACGADT